MPVAQNADEYIAMQRRMIASNPECGTSHYNLAVALLGQKKYEEAEKSLHAAIECSPNLAEAYVQLGGVCLQRGDLDGCLDFNKKAIQSRAGFAEGWGNIGFIHLQQGDVDEAIRALKKAIAYNHHFLQAYATLANAYLMQGDVTASIETGRKLIELEPNFAIGHNNLAIAYLENGEYELAVEHCDEALKLGYSVSAEIRAEIDKHR